MSGGCKPVALFALAVVALTISCSDPAAPARDPRCVYPGDTIGVLVGSTNGIVAQCAWLIAQREACYSTPVLPVPRCVLGEPVSRSQRGGGA